METPAAASTPGSGPAPDRTTAPRAATRPGNAREVGAGDQDAHAYRLRVGPVYGTARRLERRIRARFPDRHLGELAGSLGDLVQGIDDDLKRGRRATAFVYASRLLIAVIVLVVAATVVVGADAAMGEAHTISTADWPQVVESTINDIVFAGIAVFFLHALPERLERRRILRTLHQLRSLAHVVDMHQLTKDPERIRERYSTTRESVRDTMTADELFHYLDYCSEMLSLVAKSAALYAQSTSDDVVLTAIEGIESLTTGMQTKIWQKIALLP